MRRARIVRLPLILVTCEVVVSIKTIVFERNGHGIETIQVMTDSWVIGGASPAMPVLRGRHCRLAKGGTRLEYRAGDTYREIPAVIKSIV